MQRKQHKKAPDGAFFNDKKTNKTAVGRLQLQYSE